MAAVDVQAIINQVNVRFMDAGEFIKKHKMIQVRDELENRLIGWKCPECGARDAWLALIEHKSSCSVPDYKQQQ